MKRLQTNTTSKSSIFDRLKDNSIYNIDQFLDKIENGQDGCFELEITITTQRLDSYFATKLEFHITKTNQFKLSSYKEFKNQFKEVLKKNLEDFYQEILLDSMKEHSMISLSGQKSLLLCNREALKQEMKLELKRILSLTPEEKILVSEIITEILE